MKKLNRGFTAVELMIVIAIMGIMLTMAMPSFVQFTRNSRIKSGAQIVVSALRTARSYAITKRKNCAVLFDMDNNAVKIWSDGISITNWKALPKTIVMADQIGNQAMETLSVPFPNDSDAIRDIKSITFHPMGKGLWSEGEDIPNTKTIEVSDITSNDTSYIEVQRLTGRIKTSR